MGKHSSFSSEVKERAVRLVAEQTSEHESAWAATCSVAEKIGCSPQTLRSWIIKAESHHAESGTIAKAELDRRQR